MALRRYRLMEMEMRRDWLHTPLRARMAMRGYGLKEVEMEMEEWLIAQDEQRPELVSCEGHSQVPCLLALAPCEHMSSKHV